MSDSNEETTAVEQAASETSAQAVQGAADYGYVSSGNDSGNVRLIKNYALFLFPKGDSTDFRAHNGDIVLSDTDPGYWTLQLAAMEGRKDVVSAYFDVDVESDGGISIKGAGLKKEWILVLVALDQRDRPFLLYGTNAKVSDRDDVSLKSSEIMNFSMTFKMLKGTNGEQFHAWGLVTEDAE